MSSLPCAASLHIRVECWLLVTAFGATDAVIDVGLDDLPAALLRDSPLASLTEGNEACCLASMRGSRCAKWSRRIRSFVALQALTHALAVRACLDVSPNGSAFLVPQHCLRYMQDDSRLSGCTPL